MPVKIGIIGMYCFNNFLPSLEAESIQVSPETWQQMDKIEQKLYTSEDTFHAKWSPNF